MYIRGNCTLGPNYDTEFRIFCLPNALLLYPTNYSSWSVNDFDDNGDPFVAVRTITSSAANSFNVLDLAFDLLNPQPPPSGSDHYCLVAESRNPTAENPDPDWPHEDTGAFSSGALHVRCFETVISCTGPTQVPVLTPGLQAHLQCAGETQLINLVAPNLSAQQMFLSRRTYTRHPLNGHWRLMQLTHQSVLLVSTHRSFDDTLG